MYAKIIMQQYHFFFSFDYKTSILIGVLISWPTEMFKILRVNPCKMDAFRYYIAILVEHILTGYIS